MTKQNRYREVLTFELDDCTLDEMLQKLNDCKIKHPTEELKYEYTSEYGDYGGPDHVCIYYISEETDEEYSQRLEYEREKLEEKERKELGRLLGYKKPNEANVKRIQELLEKYHNG